ncbi:hypothetical protein PACTADRAFT_41907 [Pachysolen tannophilus NRRL Y-2460]|uniref:ATP-dependent DNA helicase CHL1 n=1 Tax=Pachysolen tannophilus NRRL Y-2460 TaxID=669874 RepID=A0A1E4TXA3_PACTA|nr:hypothetical protein PACTADRAFT_41907 [Pachysolen tannophilus NRRL Y-2460]
MDACGKDGNFFSHPYEPYHIQVQLMGAIYDVIDKNYKIGLFESPTGTGKTLSIICSTMTWLRNYKRQLHLDQVNKLESKKEEEEEDDDEPEWIKEVYKEKILSKQKNLLKDYELHLDEFKSEVDATVVHEIKDNGVDNRRRIKKIKISVENEDDDDDNEFVPKDYTSDGENSQIDENLKIQAEIRDLLIKVEGLEDHVVRDNALGDLINECPTTIFYSSRTHSQLNQFSHQVKLTNFKSSFEGVQERIKYLPLASRKQLCVHPKISKFENVSLINDGCLDLQQNKSKVKGKGNDVVEGCQYFPKHSDPISENLVKRFRDMTFSEVHDIEDLHKIGEKLTICPYYSVRSGVNISEIIALPYQLLLEKSARDVLGLKLKDSIVIIDEAHNLLDTISAMNSTSISLQELSDTKKTLKFYMNKFRTRLNGGNRVNLAKIIKMVDILQNFIINQRNSKMVTPGKEIQILDIFSDNNGDILNIHKLDKYLSVSKIAYKIEGYMEKITGRKSMHRSMPLLFKVTAFMKSLANPSREGKFFFDKIGEDISINYMLLDSSEIFREIVEHARCVILAGGTMEPMEDYEHYLFPYIDKQKILKFSCDHIIPDDNLKVFSVGKSCNGLPFEFTFDKRNDNKMIDGLGFTFIELAKNIPGGVVVFFPSYKYLFQVISQWQKSTIYSILNKLKKIFKEEQNSTELDDLLQNYSLEILNNKGAILFSVVGGKLSEGINFSDNLARAVIMIGLPFPNLFSGEIISKRKYIYDQVFAKTQNKQMSLEACTHFYENICMRAVNQSIGRSIRHIGDYATIYLIDKRYSENTRISSKLSGWVRKRLVTYDINDFRQVVNTTRSFFVNKGDRI